MSKHPTSELSPRDIACIEYGRKIEALTKIKHIELRRYAFLEACAARERIFRHCSECNFTTSISPSGWKCSKVTGIHPTDYACICPHYEEGDGK